MQIFEKNTNKKIIGTYSNARIKNNKKFTRIWIIKKN